MSCQNLGRGGLLGCAGGRPRHVLPARVRKFKHPKAPGQHPISEWQFAAFTVPTRLPEGREPSGAGAAPGVRLPCDVHSGGSQAEGCGPAGHPPRQPGNARLNPNLRARLRHLASACLVFGAPFGTSMGRALTRRAVGCRSKACTRSSSSSACCILQSLSPSKCFTPRLCNPEASATPLRAAPGLPCEPVRNPLARLRSVTRGAHLGVAGGVCDRHRPDYG